jgi:hypothetical protein
MTPKGAGDGRDRLASEGGEASGSLPERSMEAAGEQGADRSEPTAPPRPALPTEADLHAQGFTADEVFRLIAISDRMAHSQEAHDAEVLMRRLRFIRWLIERHLLDDDFSA